jgi:hypothetical protein
VESRIVQLVQSILLRCGIPVITYNGRGAGETTARPSWGGKGEAEDYGRVLRAGWEDMQGAMGASKEAGEVFLCVSRLKVRRLSLKGVEPTELLVGSYRATRMAPY